MYRVVKSSRLPVKIAAYLVSIGRLLCLAFLYGWRFLNKISLDWPLTLTTQPSTSSTIFIFTTLLVSKRLVSKQLCIKMTSNHVSWYPNALACRALQFLLHYNKIDPSVVLSAFDWDQLPKIHQHS